MRYNEEAVMMQGEAPAQNISEEPIAELPIGAKEIRKAREILARYKKDKANLDQKTVDNEQWWKLRHWEQMRKEDGECEPASAWLWNVIVSKHADAMDAYPEPNLLPRMRDDVEEAKKLTSIMPVVLEHNGFEDVYNDVQWYKLKQGTGIYGVFWDSAEHNGLGDIKICKIDSLSLFWEGGINDIQASANVFLETIVDNEELEAEYPELKDKLKPIAKESASFRYDDTVSLDGKSAVIDWYYHKLNGNVKVLHYCKFVGETVLFSTENDAEAYPNGWYDHGMYPFVFDPLFTIEGSPCGYGYIDIGKAAQEQIDLLNQAVVRNALLSAKPRFFIRGDGSVNEEEFADWKKDFVHTNGNLGKDSIMQIEVAPLAGNYLNLLQLKTEELKETTGNRDASNGGTTGGVTAASAIAAMQEASGKLSRDSNKSSYSAYRKVIEMCIELMRQFYDQPREFRIIGDMNRPEFINYDNTNLQVQHQGNAFGVDLGFRKPVFDIEITAQKANPYSKLSQNELALQFYNLGFFSPQMTDMALLCLEMMDFPRKDTIIEKIAENGTMQQRLMQIGQLALAMAKDHAPQLVPMIAQKLGMGGMQGGAPMMGSTSLPEVDATGSLKPKEHPGVTRSREQTQESTQPNA